MRFDQERMTAGFEPSMLGSELYTTPEKTFSPFPVLMKRHKDYEGNEILILALLITFNVLCSRFM